MPQNLRHRLYYCAAAILAVLLYACAENTDTDTAAQVKEYILSQLKTDTMADSRKAYAAIDSCRLANEADCAKLYSKVNQITFTIHHRGDAAKSLQLHKEQLDILEQSPHRSVTDTKQLLNLYIRLGASVKERSMDGISLDYYMKGLNVCDDDTLYLDHKAMLYNNIGVLYADAKLHDKAEEFFKKSLEINLKRKIHHEAFLNYANLAELYTLNNDIDKALDAAQKSLDHLDAGKHPMLLASMRLQQGDIYARQGQYDVAMLRFFSALKQNKQINYMPGVVDSYMYIGEAYLHREMPDSATVYASLALKTARDTEQWEYVADALKLLSHIQEAEGDNSHAIKTLNEAISLEDSLRNAENQLRLNNRINTFSTPHAGLGQPQKIGKVSIAVICLLAAICIFLAVRLLHSRRSRTEHAQEERENTRAMALDLDKRNRELTTLSLDKIRVQEGLTEVCDELRAVILDINPRETAKRTRLRTLLGRLDSLCNTQADEEFKQFFGRVHPDFYRVLNEKYPDLTPKDTRLCAFLYLGLTTKEIASITYREVRSVESARNRLRKKLGLDLTADLTAHLRSLAQGVDAAETDPSLP